MDPEDPEDRADSEAFQVRARDAPQEDRRAQPERQGRRVRKDPRATRATRAIPGRRTRMPRTPRSWRDSLSGFTQTSCNSQSGAIKDWAIIPAGSGFPSTFTPVSGYNCSGQGIQAERIGAGDYVVQFLGSPVTLALGTVNVAGPSLASAQVGILNFVNEGPGTFETLHLQPLRHLNPSQAQRRAVPDPVAVTQRGFPGQLVLGEAVALRLH